MTEAPARASRKASAGHTSAKMPPEIATHVRQLSHDLSNALEIVLQASYLLGMAPSGKDSAKWRAMVDDGARKAGDINLELRNYVRAHS